MKYSILIACFNKEQFIKQCIESIITQKHTNWECIIVDDCSSDKSYEIISSFSNHPQITVIRNDARIFCSSTYAKALKHATGDIVGIVDGDDLLDQEAMHIVAKRYRNLSNIEWIYTQFYWCDRLLRNCRKGVSSLPKNGKPLTDMTLSGRHCYSHWRTFRRHLSNRAILFPEGLQVSVDKNLGFTLEELGPGAFLPKQLYHYRYYKGNMSLIQGSEQKNTTRQLAKKYNLNRKKNEITVYPIVKIK